jgi:uncharacterized protein (DUF111 family)
MNPQLYDHVMERLFSMNVLDVFLTPIQMKKNRPATLLTVITEPDQMAAVTEFLLKETTTLGLRWREEERARADREILALTTRYGKIRFKVARWGNEIVNVSPEYEDCRAAARKKGVSLKLVFEEARRIALQWLGAKGEAV